MARIAKRGYIHKSTPLEDRIKGALLYKDAADKESALAEKYLENSATLEGLQNSELDADLYRDYKTWKDEVAEYADIISNNGPLDNAKSARLRRKYLSDLKPMEDKYKYRTEQIARQASVYSPDTIYNKDYSKIAVGDINIGEGFKYYKLSDIQKKAYEDAVIKYRDSEIPVDTSDDIDRLFGSIDTETFNEEDINKIRKSLEAGYSKGAQDITEYQNKLKDQELSRKIQQKQYEKLIKDNENLTTKEEKELSTVVGNNNEPIKIYTKTVKGKKYTYIKDDKGKPVVIDDSKIGEDGTMSYEDLLDIAYGMGETSHYDTSEYRVLQGKAQKTLSSIKTSDTVLGTVHNTQELLKFINEHPNAVSDITKIAKDIYGVDNLNSGELFRRGNLVIKQRIPQGGGSPFYTVSIALKSKNDKKRFKLDGTPIEETKPEDKNQEENAQENSTDNNNQLETKKDSVVVGNNGSVGNIVIGD